MVPFPKTQLIVNGKVFIPHSVTRPKHIICRCIEQLVYFAQPILDLIAEATGWKVTLVAGGPQPADEGLLHVVR